MNIDNGISGSVNPDCLEPDPSQRIQSAERSRLPGWCGGIKATDPALDGGSASRTSSRSGRVSSRRHPRQNSGRKALNAEFRDPPPPMSRFRATAASTEDIILMCMTPDVLLQKSGLRKCAGQIYRSCVILALNFLQIFFAEDTSGWPFSPRASSP